MSAGPCAEILSELRARFGVLTVLGNHDAWTDVNIVTAALQEHRIPVLRNDVSLIEQKNSRLWIAGVEDVSTGEAKIWQAVKKRPAGEATILLAHEPDYADEVSQYNVDLQLSGHSHGGQVRFPVFGPLVLPALGRKYPMGLRRIGGLQLYTNRGIGMIEIPLRVNCPPEVTLFTLRARQNVGNFKQE